MKDFKTFSDFMNQVNEIFLLTPPPTRTRTRRRSPSSSTTSASEPTNIKKPKPDPRDPHYVKKTRDWAKQHGQQQEETSVSEDIEQRLKKQAAENEQYRQERKARIEARRKKAIQRSEVSTRGVPFYDKHGKGYIKDGVKTYTERN